MLAGVALLVVPVRGQPIPVSARLAVTDTSIKPLDEPFDGQINDQINDPINSTEPVLLAAPENLNPGLYWPRSPVELPSEQDPNETDPELLEPENAAADPDNVETADAEADAKRIAWDDLEIDISDSGTNFGQGNRLITPVLTGTLPNGNTLTLSPGFNRFALPDLETVYHIPLTVGWKGAINDVVLEAAGGIDLFNRLPVDTHFKGKAAYPVGNSATVSVNLEQGPYLFNAKTLENGISTWRYGPDLFWQIDEKTSLFSLLRLGHFSDGNREQQSFSRIERKFAKDFAVALNAFNWRFQQNLEANSGYFSPPDFLVLSAEISWQKAITDDLSCRLAGNIGQQRLNGAWALGYGHQALCSVDITPAIQADLGYSFSNVSNGQSVLPGDSAYNDFQILGGIRSSF